MSATCMRACAASSSFTNTIASDVGCCSLCVWGSVSVLCALQVWPAKINRSCATHKPQTDMEIKNVQQPLAPRRDLGTASASSRRCVRSRHSGTCASVRLCVPAQVSSYRPLISISLQTGGLAEVGAGFSLLHLRVGETKKLQHVDPRMMAATQPLMAI